MNTKALYLTVRTYLQITNQLHETDKRTGVGAIIVVIVIIIGVPVSLTQSNIIPSHYSHGHLNAIIYATINKIVTLCMLVIPIPLSKSPLDYVHIYPSIHPSILRNPRPSSLRFT